MAKATGASVKINDNTYTNGMLDQQKKNWKYELKYMSLLELCL